MESEYSFNPIHDFGLDDLGLTHGQTLQKDLGLSKLGNNVYIQKVIGIALPIYIVTFNSRYSTTLIGSTRVKNIKSTWLGKVKIKGVHLYLKHIKLTPPLQLNSSMTYMVSGSLIIMRDIAGELFRNPKVVECQKINNKLKLVESK
jgi:hypothetical protein